MFHFYFIHPAHPLTVQLLFICNAIQNNTICFTEICVYTSVPSEAHLLLRRLTFKCKIKKKKKVSLKNTPVTQSILCLIFLICVKTIQRLNCIGQELKKNLQFMILTYLWHWNEVKVFKFGLNWQTKSKVIIMQCLWKTQWEFLSNQEACQLSSLNMCESQKYWYIHDLLDVLDKPTKFQLIG